MSEEENQEKPQQPKKERQYREIGEPSHKGIFIAFGVIIGIIAIGFAYFMIFHFNDAFYEKKVVRINQYD